MRKTFIALASFTALLGFAIAPANALPIGPIQPNPGANIILIAGGCGAGFHRGAYGHCVPNYVHRRHEVCRWVYGPYGRHRVCHWVY
jgi:hypothetical protein